MITDEYRAEIHRALDRAIETCGPRCSIEVTYGTRTYPDEESGMMRTEHTGAVTIAVTPPSRSITPKAE